MKQGPSPMKGKVTFVDQVKVNQNPIGFAIHGQFRAREVPQANYRTPQTIINL